MSETIVIEVEGAGTVSGLVDQPARPFCAFVFAHGAGAGMHHAFMAALADRLVAREVAVMRYQFVSMERGQRRVDPPAVAQSAVRSAVAAAALRWPALPLFAGGKSFGGRMTSQAQAAGALPRVSGIAFVGFPLHPINRPSIARAEHLSAIAVPMLFLQGSRDALATLDLIVDVTRALPRADRVILDDADHGFHVRRRSGSTDAEVLDRIADAMRDWMTDIVTRTRSNRPPSSLSR